MPVKLRLPFCIVFLILTAPVSAAFVFISLAFCIAAEWDSWGLS
jgi:hypothetical protein